jgi:hypothetical protein
LKKKVKWRSIKDCIILVNERPLEVNELEIENRIRDECSAITEECMRQCNALINKNNILTERLDDIDKKGNLADRYIRDLPKMMRRLDSLEKELAK